MSYIRCPKTLLLIIALITCLGCNSKQDKPGAPQATSGATSPTTGEIKTISGQNVAGAPAASSLDQTAARTAAAHILAQMEAGEFAAIYREASPGFQKIGSETDFVAKFDQVRRKTGLFKNQREISLTTRPDGAHVLVFSLENERFKSDRRLTLARAKNGNMVLEGLNQHDEPKK